MGPDGADVARAGAGPPVSAPTITSRAALWTPLIEGLTREFPHWTIWKNAEAALAGSGDVDSAAPEGDWDAIVLAFRRWAGDVGLGPVIECRHPPRTMFLAALDETRTTFLELDVLARKYFRGGTLFRAEELVPLSRVDARGFRMVTPAAQALILLLCNGLRWGGRPDFEGIRKRHVRELLAMDLDAVPDAARRMHLPVRATLAAVHALLDDAWDRRAMLAIERSAIVRAFREPGIIASRIRFRAVSKKGCPFLRTVFYGDRIIPGGADAWLSEVRREHRVYD